MSDYAIPADQSAIIRDAIIAPRYLRPAHGGMWMTYSPGEYETDR